MSREFKENVESMNLAAEAVQLALWRWEITDDRIWVSPNGREMFGIGPDETIDQRSSIPWPLKPRNLRQMQLGNHWRGTASFRSNTKSPYLMAKLAG